MNISFEDFNKIEIRMGKVEVCESIEGSEKLLRLEVDFGDELGRRQILSGIAKFYSPEDLIGKTLPFITNLEPRKMMGLESQGMLIAADDGTEPVLLFPDKDLPSGSKVK